MDEKVQVEYKNQILQYFERMDRIEWKIVSGDLMDMVASSLEKLKKKVDLAMKKKFKRVQVYTRGGWRAGEVFQKGEVTSLVEIKSSRYSSGSIEAWVSYEKDGKKTRERVAFGYIYRFSIENTESIERIQRLQAEVGACNEQIDKLFKGLKKAHVKDFKP